MWVSVPNAVLLVAVATAGIQGAVLCLLLGRKLFRQVPFFTAYTAVQLFMAPVMTFAYGWLAYKVYFYLYWAQEAITVTLGLMIVYEIFSILFRSYEGLTKAAKWLLIASAVFLTGVALLLAYKSTVRPEMRIAATLSLVERSIRFVQIGLLIVLFALTRYLQIAWRHYVFGIGLGFGLYATIDLVVNAMHVYAGAASLWTLTLVPPIAYMITTSVWLAYMLQKQPVPRFVETVPRHELEKWNVALREFLHR